MSVRRPVRIALLIVLVTAACAPSQPQYTRPGTDEATMRRDYRDCRDLAQRRAGVDPATQSSRSGGAMNPYDQQRAVDVYRATLGGCMGAKGYAAGRR